MIDVDAHTGEAHNIIDEKTETFIWTAHTENLDLRLVNWLEHSDEIIYVSERDGWRHLYLVDAKEGGIKNQITHGEYVVRGIDRIDEEKRQIWFHASGKNADQDPYFMHYYRVNFDGTGLVALTEGDGNHSVQFSPDRKYLIDTYSRVDMPPVHELRRTDGRLARLQARRSRHRGAASDAAGSRPEVFVAKGRDGKTDIWGVICRPRDFDPDKKYPVIESDLRRPAGLVRAQVVQRRQSVSRRSPTWASSSCRSTAWARPTARRRFTTSAGTTSRTPGFPDRILWIKAAAEKYPYMDLEPRRHLRRLGRRAERGRRRAVPSRVLQSRRRRLRLPRQSHGQGLVERAVDGLPGRPAVRRVLEHRQRPPPARQADADRRRAGRQRADRIDATAWPTR